MNDSGYTQKRALKPLLTLSYNTEQTWHFRKVDIAGVTFGKMSGEEDYWRLAAKDRANKSWFVPAGVLQDMTGNVQFYRADLDHNGIQDLVIWRSVSRNGLASSSFLILMIFNQQGRPCVFQIGGLYTANETGVDDLSDLQGNGHTQLLDMQLDSGYWITSSYQIKEVKWQRVHGRFGKLSYPALTRFTYTSNRKLIIKPVAGYNP